MAVPASRESARRRTTENNPAGRMMRRTLANMASFYTEQQSVDVREGLARRVREGWFVSLAPYGYLNARKDGHGVVEIDPIAAENVRRIFNLYAYENLTLDGVTNKVNAEGRVWRSSTPRFPRSSIHNILRDRAYIGEIEFKGQWYPGKHQPLIDRPTWERVQTLLGGANYHSHANTYSGEFMRCGHCGQWITGECKTKKTKSGPRDYVYYRCARYTKPGHPRVRVREEEIDRQVLAIFDRMRIEDETVRDWFRTVQASQTKDTQAESLAMRAELQRQETLLVQQQDRLLGELASKVFELSQTLRQQWLTADYAAKRRILEIVCLNCTLDGATLCPEMRKPFDILAEGLISKNSRGDRI